MADFFQDVERFRRPEMFLGELLKKYARGEILEQGRAPKVIYRAVVLAVDEEGGRLSRPDGRETVQGVALDGRIREYTSALGPLNPRNSIRAIVIDEGKDSFRSESDSRVLWPFFPPDQITMPVSPGEHVYVMFEDPSYQHGLWMFRVPGQDDPNFLPGADYYLTQLGPRDLNAAFDGQSTRTEQRSDDSYTTRSRGSRRDLNSLF